MSKQACEDYLRWMPLPEPYRKGAMQDEPE